jgi:hypothetical protein
MAQATGCRQCRALQAIPEQQSRRAVPGRSQASVAAMSTTAAFVSAMCVLAAAGGMDKHCIAC